MDRQREKRLLEEQLAKYHELARAFPEGAVNETMLDLIAEVKRQIQALDKEKAAH
ncbi:hypothetical protein [Bradyrhizobium sp. CSS354]|uniref:hypothetical protein n=1 Tax=Bradyrhizobium sp. CSS354 TaxID=2699172 RepID=UPI0023B0E9D1|nr:hypothetical protein [Bradyrhizobium sp. CSS354]MDE5460202.1 hypothetical protein [Bradyrhizobium sp. CSS354]